MTACVACDSGKYSIKNDTTGQGATVCNLCQIGSFSRYLLLSSFSSFSSFLLPSSSHPIHSFIIIHCYHDNNDRRFVHVSIFVSIHFMFVSSVSVSVNSSRHCVLGYLLSLYY